LICIERRDAASLRLSLCNNGLSILTTTTTTTPPRASVFIHHPPLKTPFLGRCRSLP